MQVREKKALETLMRLVLLEIYKASNIDARDGYSIIKW